MSAPLTPQPADPVSAPAEPTAPALEATQSQPEAQQDVNALPEWAREAIRKANKEAADYRGALRAAEPKLSEYDRLVEASKSDAQRLEEAKQAAERRANDAEQDAIRYKVAATHGIGMDYFDLLGTGDEASVTARAQRIAALQQQAAAAAGKPPVPTTRPGVAQLQPGASPSNTQSEDDVLYHSLFGG
jgi:hypothetical protein